MYIVNFINEIRAMHIVRKVYKEHKNEFDKMKIRVDWFGKMRVVINRDLDIRLGSDDDEVYLHNELAKIWNFFTRLNIVDILAYELKPFEISTPLPDNMEEVSQGYFVDFTPAWNLDRQYVTWKSVLAILLILGAIITGLIILI